jgi:hypothetical protein
MTQRLRRLRALLGVVCLIAIGAPAFAQQLPTVRRDRRETERRREVFGVQIGLSGSSIQQRDAAPGEVLDDIPQVGSKYYADLSAAARFSPYPVGGLQYTLTASSGIRRYERGDEIMVVGHSAGAGLTWLPSERTQLMSSASFSYIPSYALNSFLVGDPAALVTSAGTLPLSAFDFSLAKRISYATSGNVSLSQSLTRRTSLSLTYTGVQQEFAVAADPSFSLHDMSARLTYSLTRKLGLRLGYGRRIGDFQTADGLESVAMDDIEAGLAFSDSIGVTRTTTFSFETGSTIQDVEGNRAAKLTGNAALTQQLGDRGNISLAFSRGSDLRPGFRGPIFSNTVSLTGAYSITDRLLLTAYANGFIGESRQLTDEGADNGNRGIRSMSGRGRLGYTLFRRAEVYGEYLVFDNRIESAVDLISTVARNQASHTIRAGFTYAVPIIRRLPGRGTRSRPAPDTSERN